MPRCWSDQLTRRIRLPRDGRPFIGGSGLRVLRGVASTDYRCDCGFGLLASMSALPYVSSLLEA